MRKSEHVPDYLISNIVRHANVILDCDKNTTKYINAERLLRKEIRKLDTYRKSNIKHKIKNDKGGIYKKEERIP